MSTRPDNARKRGVAFPVPFSGVVWLTCVLGLPGCGGSGSHVTFTSYRDAYFPEDLTVEFAECVHFVDASGDYRILARRVDDGDTSEPVEQMLHVHLFWKPRPGWTFTNPTMNDALVRFLVRSGDDATLYSGTGFVSLQPRKLDDGVRVNLERARLDCVAGRDTPTDVLGTARASGRVLSRPDPARAVDLLRTFEQRADALSASGATTGPDRERRPVPPGRTQRP